MVNNDQEYETFYHLEELFIDSITNVKLLGGAEISYTGFGGRGRNTKSSKFKPKQFDSDLTPAPPVGFNVTFQCPEGYVFNSDWFATPFLMMTCQVCSRVNNQKFNSVFQSDGSFDVPDWEAYQCVLRKRY